MTVPAEALEAAKAAMQEVTPPPGVSKADWLAEHGRFALIAGAIAAAAPFIAAQALRRAADNLEIRMDQSDPGSYAEQQYQAGYSDAVARLILHAKGKA